jgi:Flp pilus assembly protein TadD
MSRRKHQLEALFQQAVRLHQAGRLAEAEPLYRQLLAASPDHADALHMLGVLAMQAGHPRPALDLIDQAIARRPDADPRGAIYHVNRAGALFALGQPELALAAAQTAIRLRRASAEAHQSLGHSLSDLGRAHEAVQAYREALRLNPSLPGLHAALGLALQEASDLDGAEAALREAVRRAPGDFIEQANLASVVKSLGRLEEADAIYQAALRRAPGNPLLLYNKAVLELLAGRFADGWEHWEARWQARGIPRRPLTGPQWRGEPLAGRTLLVHAEQGLGDTLQFCRFGPDIAARGLAQSGRVILEVQPPLVRLLQQLPGVQVIAAGAALPAYDLWCPLLSLPRALGMAALDDIPGSVPYLRADPAMVAKWQARMAALEGLRVGLVWAGNAEDIRLDNRRSLSVERLLGAMTVPGLVLVSLQKGEAAAGLKATGLGAGVHNWTAELNDFADTAALVEALDLVISVDTSVVHLAGALGKPVWLLNRLDTCWRWLLGRDDSPWYPTLRQFRQVRAGDWDSVLAEVGIALAAEVDRHAPSALATSHAMLTRAPNTEPPPGRSSHG